MTSRESRPSTESKPEPKPQTSEPKSPKKPKIISTEKSDKGESITRKGGGGKKDK